MILFVMVVTILFALFPPFVVTEMKVNYVDEQYNGGKHWKVYASLRDHITESDMLPTYQEQGESKFLMLDWAWRSGEFIKRVDPVDYYVDYFTTYDILIRDIEISINGVFAGTLSGEKLLDCFTTNDQAELYTTEAGEVGIHILGADSQMLPTEIFRQTYVEFARPYAGIIAWYFLPILLILCLWLSLYGKYVEKNRKQRFFRCCYAGATVLIVGIFTGVVFGNVRSNPDEIDSVYAVQYYFNHLFSPDVRELPAEAFSLYGVTRLSELNLYYILAAAIARWFSFEWATRFLGVLLLTILLGFGISKMEKNRYLLCVLLLTPQVWYLYSYCTSDAWDFFIAVFILYQLSDQESMLQKLVKKGLVETSDPRLFVCQYFYVQGELLCDRSI